MAELWVDKLDQDFRKEVEAGLGGPYLEFCYACGACTGSCPVREMVKEFDPRKIIHMIVMGMKEQVLSSDLIWYCCLCSTCSFICPQKVNFGEVMKVLRALALKEGYIDASLHQRIQAVEQFAQGLRLRLLRSVLGRRESQFRFDWRTLWTEANRALKGKPSGAAKAGDEQ